jgi:hypothetical protein
MIACENVHEYEDTLIITLSHILEYACAPVKLAVDNFFYIN